MRLAPRRRGIIEPKARRKLAQAQQRAIEQAGQGRDQRPTYRAFVVTDGVSQRIIPTMP